MVGHDPTQLYERTVNSSRSDLRFFAREQINTRSDSVNSFASLKDSAQNLLRGDD